MLDKYKSKSMREVIEYCRPTTLRWSVIRIGLDFLHLLDRKADSGEPALNLREPSNVEFADIGNHWRTRRQIVLDADHFVAACGKDVRKHSEAAN